MIRPVIAGDAPELCELYNYYIQHTTVTFEETPVSAAEMEARIRHISPAYPWLVWEGAGEILGYAYVHRWKDRQAYRFSAEDSIYVKQGHERQGIGSGLMTALLEEVRKTKIHALIAILCVPNEPSVRLHEGFGFRKAAHFTEVGYKFGAWLDVAYWQCILP